MIKTVGRLLCLLATLTATLTATLYTTLHGLLAVVIHGREGGNNDHYHTWAREQDRWDEAFLHSVL